jgi:uncharacterized membrane protein YccC
MDRPRKYLEKWFASLASPTRSDWIFALRTVSAGLIALLAAYALKLEHPQWAMMTVFVVAQPVAGMVLAKGFYRLIGTLVGAVAAVAITFLCGSNAWLFVAAISLWIGLCTYVSSLLRNPEAYGAALAGYTATIVGLPAFGQPHLLLDLATARCAEIVLGIVCAGLTSRLILPQLARDAMRARLRRSILDLATYAKSSFSGGDAAKLETLYRKLVAESQALGEMRAYARLEAPSQATHAYPVRRTIGHLLSALSAVRMLHAHPRPPDAPKLVVRGELRVLLEELSSTPGALDDTGPWIARLQQIADRARRMPDEIGKNDPDPVGAVTRLMIAAEFADALKEILRGLDALAAPPSGRTRDRRQPALVIHRDRPAALRNAVRAAVATMLVATFWLATRWSELAGVLIIVAVVSSLFAPRPNPVQVAWGFFKGTLLALPVAFVISQYALPAFPGFGWFIVFVVPVLIPASLAMANPRYVGVATAFAINFLAFLSPHQVMTYDPVPFLAGSASILVGILLAIGVYLVVLPADPWATVNRIAESMREDLVRLCLHERMPRRTAFESLAYDRVNQLLPLAQRIGRKADALFGGSIASVAVGLEALRLRRALATGLLSPEAGEAIGQFLRWLAHDLIVRPSGSAAVAAESIRGQAAAIAVGDAPAGNLQAAASLRIIAVAIEDYPEFFRRS